MGLVAITSAADQDNPGSGGALQKPGYCQTGMNYHAGVSFGRVIHADRYLLVNPADRTWNFFWGDDGAPPAFNIARQKTLAAMEKAAGQVAYL